MAWVRIERQAGEFAGRPQYDGICETETDIEDAASNGYAAFNGSHIDLAPGSAVFCLESGKLYVVDSSDTFQEVIA